MNVLVIGANGQVGQKIVQELAETNHEAVAMVRKEEQMEHLKEIGASEVVLADLEEDFSNAFDGVDAVIFAAGSGPKTGPDKTLTIDLWGSVKAVRYAEEKGIKRFIQLSSVGTDNPDAGGEKMKPYLVAKRAADDVLQATDLAYTIVRPARLTDDQKTGNIEASAKGFDALEDRSIPRADVANVLVQVLDRPNTHQKVFEIFSGGHETGSALDKL